MAYDHRSLSCASEPTAVHACTLSHLTSLPVCCPPQDGQLPDFSNGAGGYLFVTTCPETGQVVVVKTFKRKAGGDMQDWNRRVASEINIAHTCSQHKSVCKAMWWGYMPVQPGGPGGGPAEKLPVLVMRHMANGSVRNTLSRRKKVGVGGCAVDRCAVPAADRQRNSAITFAAVGMVEQGQCCRMTLPYGLYSTCSTAACKQPGTEVRVPHLCH